MFGVKIYSRMLTAVLVILACLCLALPVFAEGVVAKIEGGAEYTRIKAALEDVQDGDTVVLLQDTAENVEISGKKITLDLGGFTLTSEGEGTFFSVTDEAEVTVKNGTLAGAVEDGKPVQVEYAVYVKNATFTLDNATISGHSVSGSGGGIYADKAAVINVQNGAVITGNTANGKTATSASAVGNGGGGIYACNGSKVTVDASTISKNVAEMSGGGLMMNNSSLTVNNASAIIENKAKSTKNNNGGGGIYSVNQSSVSLNGSKIAGNIAYKLGGGVYIFDGRAFGNLVEPLTIEGCELSGNALSALPASNTTMKGLAIYIKAQPGSANAETITLAKSIIAEHTVPTAQILGSVCIEGTSYVDVSITDTAFTNNSGKMDSGSASALFISDCGDLTISGGSFTKNDGGAAPILAFRALTSFTCNEVEFEENTGHVAGGLYISTDKTQTTIKASTFTGNESLGAESNTAGAIVTGGPTTLNGCRISGNTSAAGAGGICAPSALTVNNTVVTGNSGAKVGGILSMRHLKFELVPNEQDPTANVNAAVYGNTTTGISKDGHDLYIADSSGDELTSLVMAASKMKDGDKSFEDYAFVSGSQVLREPLKISGQTNVYTAQYVKAHYVALNVSGDICGNSEKKYEKLSDAIAAVEGEDSCTAGHVIKLIAGEDGEFGNEIFESVSVNEDLELQLNDRTLNGTTTVAKDAKLVLSGSGAVAADTQDNAALVIDGSCTITDAASISSVTVNGDCIVSGAAMIPTMTVNGACTVSGAATIPMVTVNGDCAVTGAASLSTIHLAEGKSVAVTAGFGGTEKKQVDVYLADEVIKDLNEAKEDKSVVLFRPFEDAAIESLLPYVNVPEANRFVKVGMEQGNIVASCEKVTGVYLDGVNGSNEQDGLTPATAVKTFDRAQTILKNTEGAGGIYVLGTVTVSDNRTWNLEGKWLKRYHSYDGNLVCVADKGELTLANIVVDGSAEFIVANAAMVCVDEGGILNIATGAELCNNKRNNRKNDYEQGGAVFSEGIVNMSGGIVRGNTADNGAGICMSGENAKLNLSGGVIEKNVGNTNVPQEYGSNGGGVCLRLGADMAMTGGMISGNTARYGGGIAVGAYNDVPDSVLNMTGGVVEKNEAAFQGGGIFVQTNCTANISAGSILNNKAAPKIIGLFAGGGIYVNGYIDGDKYSYGELHLTNALICGNIATKHPERNCHGGGGIAGCESSKTTIYTTHGAAIYGNTTSGNSDYADLVWNNSGTSIDAKPVGTVAEHMLGGGSYNWAVSGGTDFGTVEDGMALRSEPTQEAKDAADALAKVFISGNSTGGYGGGIGSNGTVIIGVDSISVTFPVKKEVSVPDGLTGPAEWSYTINVAAQNGAPAAAIMASTVSNSADMVTFGPFTYTETGKYSYSVKEVGDVAGVSVEDAKTVTVEVAKPDGEFTATVTSTNDEPLTFTNTYGVEPTTASFPVKKVLEVSEGMEGPGSWSYDITVTANDGAPAANKMTGMVRNDADTVTFGPFTYDKPGTYTYTVKESGEVGGVTNDSESSKTVTVTVVDNKDGTLTATASSTDDKPLTFTNTYGVEPTTASFPVKKVLEVPEGLTPADLTRMFTFTLTADKGIPMPETTSYANLDKDGGVVTFGEIEYTKPGEYKYTITETGSADGVTNDKDAAKTVTVTVKDNGDGTLTATASSTTETPLTFTNTYGVEPMTASFPVKKELTVPEGMEGPGSWSYDITVTANDGAPAAKTMTGTVSNSADTVTFGPFTYDKPGTYTYAVKENGEVDGVTNDAESSKTVTVTVEDNGDGTLTATASSTTDKPLTFTNKYSASTTTVSFPVKKVLKVPEGMEGPESWSYTIDVAAQNGAPAAKTMTGTVSNSADTVTFGPFTYDKPGEYKYTITETGSADGVTNDSESSKKVTVTVKDNGDGTLTATADSTDETPLTFTNKYGVKPTTASFPVKKVLTVPVGMEGPGSWSYDIDVAAQNGAPEAKTMTGTVSNSADTVTFGPFTYDKPGTYTYAVTETGTVAGVTNDAESSKTVTVTVKDNGDGTLTATASSTDDKPLTFTNTYGVKPTAVAIHVSKVLTGRALNAGEFSFELKNAAGETLQTKANAADGSVVFDAISYAAPGAHAYTIHEVSGDLGGVTYDGGKIEVAVTVIDNGDGTLTATAVYGDKKQFENSYATNDKLVLNGIKNLVGREFRADEVFEVELLQNGTVIQRCMVGAVNGNKAAFSFDPITYTTAEVGTYQYTVREKAGSLKGITYDATQYTVDVTVSDDGKGDLIVDAVYTVNGKAAENIVFTNIYEATGELTLNAEKTVNGIEPTADQVFDFTLSDANGEIETVQNKLNEIEFAKLTYTLEDLGEHTYTVKESKTDKAGYAIDETVYTVKVTVTDNGDGTLKVEKKITANGKPAEGMTFDNKHSATLTISKKVEGCTTEETFPIKVWLFDAKGNELKGEHAYTGDVTGKLTSGNAIELGHGQEITIEDLPVGSRYKVEETRDPRFTTMVNSLMMNTAEGEIVNGGNMAAFVNRLITTMFKVRKEWQGGDGGSIILTLYANGEKLEDQPAYTQEGDMYYYTGLPMYDEDGDEIIYSAKEKYVDGFLTIYKNVEPYAEETKAIYNGGTIINKAITTIKVQKVWSGLAEGAEMPEITLILHCNGEVYDRKTPDPDEDGWYVYGNLPVFVNGERAVYSVTEEPMEGCSTIYTNNGEEGDCAYNGGTITNIVVPKTGDETPVELWMTGLLLSVAAIVLIGKKRTKA